MIKDLILLKIQKMMDTMVDLLQCSINFLIKRHLVEQSKNDMSNKELAYKLHKPIIRKFKKSKIYSSFIDNIWVFDIQLIGKFNEGIPSLLCVIDTLITHNKDNNTNCLNIVSHSIS